MTSVNKIFGHLVRGAINAIADFEGQNVSIIEAELSEQICMAPTAIHRFKAGYVPRDPKIIEVLAEAGVRRAYLNRTWLERLLRTARYPEAAELIERLFPSEATPPAGSGRIYSNLPPPTSSQFVMRTAPYNAVLEGLRQRSAVVVIVSLGGMGKTCLAREIAANCLRRASGDDNLPRFDAAVWISDQDEPGSTSLTQVLDEIACTLDHPGLTQFDQVRKRREVEQLLRRQRIMVIVDNFETIIDDSLLPWLLRLPEPSKALITIREYRKEFQQGAWLVELGGMSDDESRLLIAGRARQLNLHLRNDGAIRQLIAITGGNPKAIEVALGLVKTTGQTLAQAIERLHIGATELFTDLFTTGWSLLGSEAQQVLLAMTLFPASAGRHALAEVAGLPEAEFFNAVRQLTELAFLNTEQSEEAHRDGRGETHYSIHPLTRSFVETMQTGHDSFLTQARERWLVWAVRHAASFGYAFDNVVRLDLLDREETTLFAALTWAFEHERYHEATQIARGLEFYYYIRAHWSKKAHLHQMYIEAAYRLEDTGEEITALCMHIQLLSRQVNAVAAEPYVSRLLKLAQTAPPNGELSFHIEHALGLYHLTTGQPSAAEQHWRRIIDQAGAWGLPDHMVIGAHHWLGVCLTRQKRRSEAYELFEAALAQARQHGYQRMVGQNQVQLALLDLDQDAIEQATQRLEESQATTHERDWEQHARTHQALARIHLHHGDRTAAQAALLKAEELFERMGLTGERSDTPLSFVAHTTSS